jgi:para-aminobenzoate synthetase component 1
VVTLEQWESYKQDYNMLPVAIKLPIHHFKVMDWLRETEKRGIPFFALESGKSGRYCFFGSKPFLDIQIKEGCLVVNDSYGEESCSSDIWSELKALLRSYRGPRIESLPKFSGGVVCFFNYDFARYIEELPETALDDLGLPEAHFHMYKEITVWDRTGQNLIIVHYCNIDELPEGYPLKRAYEETLKNCSASCEQWLRWTGPVAIEDPLPPMHIDIESWSDLQVSFTKEAFIDAVGAIQKYITAGDVFQVNLSVRQSRPLQTEPLDIYGKLRNINPSPYMGYLHFDQYQMVSGSPELLVKLEGDLVETRPIAGTRPRGDNREEDLLLANELINNEKERAEHIMLVDLERNDLGRISQFGTVHVNELMVIEEYSHVMHIVSNIRGKLAEGKDALDVIAATFPGGTITGAPKVRTMEIIEELEPVRRGPYTGSIGWIDYNGNMELNIIIRTLVAKEGVAHVQAGAGIVIDSDPEREYCESLNKAKALWRAVQLSEQQMSRVE